MIKSIISWRDIFSCSILVGSKTMPLAFIIEKVCKYNTILVDLFIVIERSKTLEIRGRYIFTFPMSLKFERNSTNP